VSRERKSISSWFKRSLKYDREATEKKGKKKKRKKKKKEKKKPTERSWVPQTTPENNKQSYTPLLSIKR
jgi:hypothetical protein